MVKRSGLTSFGLVVVVGVASFKKSSSVRALVSCRATSGMMFDSVAEGTSLTPLRGVLKLNARFEFREYWKDPLRRTGGMSKAGEKPVRLRERDQTVKSCQ